MSRRLPPYSIPFPPLPLERAWRAGSAKFPRRAGFPKAPTRNSKVIGESRLFSPYYSSLALQNLNDLYRPFPQTPRALGGAHHAVAPVQALPSVGSRDRRLEHKDDILLELPAAMRLGCRARGNRRVITKAAPVKQRPEHKRAVPFAPVDDELVQLADCQARFKNLVGCLENFLTGSKDVMPHSVHPADEHRLHALTDVACPARLDLVHNDVAPLERAQGRHNIVTMRLWPGGPLKHGRQLAAVLNHRVNRFLDQLHRLG